jgi:hypothetical protein
MFWENSDTLTRFKQSYTNRFTVYTPGLLQYFEAHSVVDVVPSPNDQRTENPLFASKVGTNRRGVIGNAYELKTF